MAENPEAMRARNRRWKAKNREKVGAENLAYMNKRYREDAQFKARVKAYAASPERREVLNARARERYKTDAAFRERQKAERRRYNAAHRAERNAYTKAWRLRTIEHRENYRLQYEYGITASQYQELFEAQRGLCLLCNKPPTEKRFAVDHDHATGVIRGLLHRSCNSTFRGVFGDDIKELHRAFMRFAEMTTHVTNIVEDEKSA